MEFKNRKFGKDGGLAPHKKVGVPEQLKTDF
jgi:hypothetical protein